MILVVDDDEAIREVLGDMFTEVGRETLIYASAEHALDALGKMERESIEVIISDHGLPGMSGSEFLLLCQLMLPAKLHILISGCPPDFIPEGILLMHKPFSPERLLETVECHLETAQANKQAGVLL